MLRFIFLLLFIIFQVHASNEIKIKAQHRKENVYVKALIHYPTVRYKEAEKTTGDSTKISYISHITVRVEDRIVFDISASPYLKNKFHFNYISRENDENLKIIATDNQNIKFIKTCKIKKFSSNRSQEKLKTDLVIMDYQKKNPKIWDIISIEDAIKELYGVKKIISNIQPKQICGYYLGDEIKLPITTAENIKSIAIFQSHRIHPTVAIINTSIEDKNNFTLNISTERDDTYYGGKGEFTIILENSNGNLHKIIQNYDIAGYHESCYGNEVKNDF